MTFRKKVYIIFCDSFALGPNWNTVPKGYNGLYEMSV